MMELSVKKSNHLKAMAILMMLWLHLFNVNYKGLYNPAILVAGQPLSFYISIFCDACVPIFAFVSGYGLYYKYQKKKDFFARENRFRLKKMYLNLWIVILLFPILLGLFLQAPQYPGSILKILMNSTAIQTSYSGIWWYFTTYVLIVLSSKFLFYLLDRYSTYVVFVMSFVLYLIAFYFRVYKTDLFSNEVLKWFHNQGARYGLVQFEFLLGAIALKHQWITKFSKLYSKIKLGTVVGIILIIFMFITRCFVPNLFVAPLCAIAFTLVWNNLKLGRFIERSLDFLSVHSTNVWLCHSFFYAAFFRDFIYSPNLPIFIFVLLLSCSLLGSFVINFFYNRLQKYF